MTSETRSAPDARAATELIAPDVRVGGRRALLTPHNCFACGQLNVHGLRLELHAADDRCWTELVLPERFEGWEGIAHGGIVATILDEVMGWAIIGTDAWGVTARMTVEYKRPARVGGHYRAEGRVVRVRRRVVESAAELVDADSGELVATAEAIYVAVPEDRKRELKRRYAYALVPDDGDATTAKLHGRDAPGRVDAESAPADRPAQGSAAAREAGS